MSDSRSLLTILAAVVAGAYATRFVIPGKYRPLFETAGAAEGVDPNLLHALQLKENPREDPAAIGAVNVNGTRDYGLMQINSANFPALGLGALKSDGTPATLAWKDPPKNVRAAAKLLAAQQRRAPHLGVADHISIYNAGFSDQDADPVAAGKQLRPKLDRAGGYFNGPYVREAYLWWLFITFAGLAPFKTLGWKAA